jgi:hypothetical protein
VNRLAPRTELDPGHCNRVARAFVADESAQEAERARAALRPAARGSADAKLRRVGGETVGDRYAEGNRATAELTALEPASYGWPVT